LLTYRLNFNLTALCRHSALTGGKAQSSGEVEVKNLSSNCEGAARGNLYARGKGNGRDAGIRGLRDEDSVTPVAMAPYYVIASPERAWQFRTYRFLALTGLKCQSYSGFMSLILAEYPVFIETERK